MENEILLQKGIIWPDEVGIIRIVWSPGVELTLADAEASMAEYERLRQGRRLAMLVDSRKIKGMSRQARCIYASERTAQVTTAVAILIESPFNIVMGNFYLQISKPVTPTRLFESDVEAIEWLKTFA